MISAPAYKVSLWLEVPVGSLAMPAEKAHEALPALDAVSADATLVDAALGGNERAFRYLVERYQAHIVRTVTGMLGQSSDIDDTVQEVFVRFHTALASFRGDSSIKTFLTRIAINRSLDVLRSRKRRFFAPWDAEQAEKVESGSPTPETLAIRSDEMVRLRSAINTLSPRHKAVVVLRLIDGLSTRETADVLRIPYGTVLSRLKRALVGLRETIGDSSRMGSRRIAVEDAMNVATDDRA
ncbi:MAG: RNA polymerase sigma factor [Bacteroidetes bacterium]|nr:RNA polymerase sigma factor [Bacteroidota bacterium]